MSTPDPAIARRRGRRDMREATTPPPPASSSSRSGALGCIAPAARRLPALGPVSAPSILPFSQSERTTAARSTSPPPQSNTPGVVVRRSGAPAPAFASPTGGGAKKSAIRCAPMTNASNNNKPNAAQHRSVRDQLGAIVALKRPTVGLSTALQQASPLSLVAAAGPIPNVLSPIADDSALGGAEPTPLRSTTASAGERGALAAQFEAAAGSPRAVSERSTAPSPSQQLSHGAPSRAASVAKTIDTDLSIASAAAHRGGRRLRRRQRRVLESLAVLRMASDPIAPFHFAVAPTPLPPSDDDDASDASSQASESSSGMSTSASFDDTSSDGDAASATKQQTMTRPTQADREAQRTLRETRHRYLRLHQLLRLRYRAIRGVNWGALDGAAQRSQSEMVPLVGASWTSPQASSSPSKRSASMRQGQPKSALREVDNAAATSPEPAAQDVYEETFEALVTGTALRMAARTLEALGATRHSSRQGRRQGRRGGTKEQALRRGSVRPARVLHDEARSDVFRHLGGGGGGDASTNGRPLIDYDVLSDAGDDESDKHSSVLGAGTPVMFRSPAAALSGRSDSGRALKPSATMMEYSMAEEKIIAHLLRHASVRVDAKKKKNNNRKPASTKGSRKAEMLPPAAAVTHKDDGGALRTRRSGVRFTATEDDVMDDSARRQNAMALHRAASMAAGAAFDGHLSEQLRKPTVTAAASTIRKVSRRATVNSLQGRSGRLDPSGMVETRDDGNGELIVSGSDDGNDSADRDEGDADVSSFRRRLLSNKERSGHRRPGKKLVLSRDRNMGEDADDDGADGVPSDGRHVLAGTGRYLDPECPHVVVDVFGDASAAFDLGSLGPQLTRLHQILDARREHPVAAATRRRRRASVAAKPLAPAELTQEPSGTTVGLPQLLSATNLRAPTRGASDDTAATSDAVKGTSATVRKAAAGPQPAAGGTTRVAAIERLSQQQRQPPSQAGSQPDGGGGMAPGIGRKGQQQQRNPVATAGKLPSLGVGPSSSTAAAVTTGSKATSKSSGAAAANSGKFARRGPGASEAIPPEALEEIAFVEADEQPADGDDDQPAVAATSQQRGRQGRQRSDAASMSQRPEPTAAKSKDAKAAVSIRSSEQKGEPGSSTPLPASPKSQQQQQQGQAKKSSADGTPPPKERRKRLDQVPAVPKPKPEGEQFSGVTSNDVWKRVYLARGSPCLPALRGAAPDPKVKSTGPKLRAVVTAITDFRDERILPCPTAERDAEAVSIMFEMFGYHVTRLYGKGIAVNKDTITHAVKVAIAECGQGESNLCAIYVAGRGTEGSLHGLDGSKHYVLHHDTKLSAISRHSVLVLEDLAQMRTDNVHPIVYAEIHPLNIPLKGVEAASVGCGFACVRSMTPSLCMTFRYPAHVTGIFTWYFLKGLQGDAVRSGRVTPGLINAFVYTALMEHLNPKKLEGDSAILSQLVRADGVAEMVSKNNQMFKYRAQLQQRKLEANDIRCKFVVEAVVSVAYLEDVEGFKRTFVRRVHDLFYPEGKWYSSGPRCVLESFARSGQFHVYLDPKKMPDALGTVMREGSIDGDVQALTGAVFSAAIAEMQEQSRREQRDAMRRAAEEQAAAAAAAEVERKKQQANQFQALADAQAATSKRGGKKPGLKTAAKAVGAVVSIAKAGDAADAAAGLNARQARMAWRSNYSPGVAEFHFAPKYRLIHSMSLLLVSTTYPAKLDGEGEPHECFEDDTTYASMATIALATELGRRNEALNVKRPGGDDRTLKERRAAARRADPLKSITFSSYTGGAAKKTTAPADTSAAGGETKEVRDSDDAGGALVLFRPKNQWTPETREITGLTVSHPSIVPAVIYDEYYVRNTQRVGGMQILRAQEKVFLTFSGTERDFMQMIKHGRLGSFTGPKHLHQCAVHRVEFIAGSSDIHRGLGKLQAIIRGGYQRGVLKYRLRIARKERDARASIDADRLRTLSEIKVHEEAARRDTFFGLEAHGRDGLWEVNHELRSGIIGQMLYVVSTAEEKWFRNSTVGAAQAVANVELQEAVARSRLFSLACTLTRARMGLANVLAQERMKRDRVEGIEMSDRQKIRAQLIHLLSRRSAS